MAGIAQGTFYNFFESKEVIYFLLLEQDEKEIKQNVIDILKHSNEITATVFANVIFATVKQIENYPLIQRLFTTDEYEILVRKLPNDLLKEHSDRDMLSFNPLLEQWKDEGKIDANISNEVVTSALRAFFLMTIHKREIGESLYDQTLQFMAEGIALSLFKERENT
ncbi:TetR/AcrR family transcriptional regulator [Ornithinibacillus scapharcae]|uniref:TetR/AcrR family transcriptional regulator n=1 Tax=Ornithinibacillus scapharcae TaxID=1147159 RepID=UPI000225BD3D|nr:TetR/AcrR family transcriptional regulator [Ornithinibacillus scapharcae]